MLIILVDIKRCVHFACNENLGGEKCGRLLDKYKYTLVTYALLQTAQIAMFVCIYDHRVMWAHPASPS